MEEQTKAAPQARPWGPRQGGGADSHAETAGGGSVFYIDVDSRTVEIQDRAVRLTPTELRLLNYLVARRGRWVTTSDLIRRVFGTNHRPDTPLVRVHVHAVRRKLEAHAFWLEADARRLRGYRWVGPGAASAQGSRAQGSR